MLGESMDKKRQSAHSSQIFDLKIPAEIVNHLKCKERAAKLIFHPKLEA